MTRSKTMKIAAALTMVTFNLGSPAAAAARASTAPEAPMLSPWVALSALGSTASSAALCGSATTSAAAASSAQGTAPGCVLPVVDAPPPVVPTTEPVAAVAPVERGFSVLPLLLGLAGVAAIAALLMSGDGDDDIDITPEPVTQP